MAISVASVGRHVADIFFPPRCVVCEANSLSDRESPWICEQCAERCFPNTVEMCSRCAARVRVPAPMVGCGLCHDQSFGFSRAIALGNYADRLRDAIYRFKRPHQENVAFQFGRCLGRLALTELADVEIDCIAPMPTHFLRYWSRGSNPAAVLAAGIARETGWPVVTDLLRYVRPTQKQGLLSRTQRIENARGAMQMRSCYQVRGATILLVDDVMASGATANEACRALRQGKRGAAEIYLTLVGRGLGRY